MSSLGKFRQLLRQLFQFDCADLDFGIYRILNYKRQQVEEFITCRLPQIVDEAFEAYAEAGKENLQREVERKQREIRQAFGEQAFDQHGQLQLAFRETPLGKEYLALQEKKEQYQVSEDLKTRVYNDLYTFFSRYYEDGDFIAKRRYGRHETYAIPYNGEEVVLHWATKDQYYIKTGERFKNYRFTVQGYTVAFELRNATTEQNNNKGDKRYFVLASSEPVAWDPTTKTLTVYFEYRPLNDAEQEQYGKKELNENAAQAILEQVQDPALKALLAKAEAANGQSLLMKHLTRFTRRNTSDFFIHKDLRGFLRRELDFFIKSKCLLLDELLAQDKNLTHQHILRARVVRDIGHKIIDFLAQVEDFQKRLFEKKKFVIETHYCLTLDRIFAIEDDETRSWLLEQIIENDAQWDEWVQLFAIDKLEDPPLPFGERVKGEGQTQIKSRTKEERSALIKQFAREMRHAPTDAEQRLWYFLRDRRLGGYKFRRQHPVGNYIADFACIEGRLIVELDGGQHAELFQQEKDEAKTAFFTERGFRVLRFWNHQVLNDTQAVLEEILRVLEESPHPNPLPKGEREMAFLKAHPYLVIDTRHFPEEFKWRLLASFDDLDNALDGILIKSENFQALNLLLERYRGKVKCIYIDPPYNTGSDEFLYKDGYRHSSWLSMMADRLELAKQFMADDGSIYLQIDWNEDFRLRELMNMIFGEEQFRNKIIWYYTNKIPDTRKRLFTNATDYLLFYAKTELNQFFPLTEPREVPIKVSKMRKEKGKKIYEKDEQGKGIYIERSERVMDNVWCIPLLHAHPEMVKFSTQKPEEIARRVFASSTLERELVLDFFLGSGTAASVATKMNRKWIGVEMGDFFDTVVLNRLKRVLAGEQTGISQSVSWKGGGFFKYLYLEQYEDTLNNLELPRAQEGQLALERFRDEYLLRYMLEFETQGSPSLLNLEQFQDPFAYKLKVQEGDEIKERVVDLVETFNYLLGIHVKKMCQFQDNGRRYRAVLGENGGKRIVIVWRPLKGLNSDKTALRQDQQFIEGTVLPALLGEDKKPDRLLVNGICYVPDAEPIEPEFKRLMWKEGQNGQEA
jgi:adenine specific DNA methylase Mod/very-short-patch-repair endonuclease